MASSVSALKEIQFQTPLGGMIAISDEKAVYLLEFIETRYLQRKIQKVCQSIQAHIVSGTTSQLTSIQQEVRAYFSGDLQVFQTPIVMLGTSFQQEAWAELCRIPYGETRSYGEQAQAIQRPKAYRAVANANGSNQHAILIPCHRIIHSNGGLGGYGGGLERKQWLLDHEKRYFLK